MAITNRMYIIVFACIMLLCAVAILIIAYAGTDKEQQHGVLLVEKHVFTDYADFGPEIQISQRFPLRIDFVLMLPELSIVSEYKGSTFSCVIPPQQTNVMLSDFDIKNNETYERARLGYSIVGELWQNPDNNTFWAENVSINIRRRLYNKADAIPFYTELIQSNYIGSKNTYECKLSSNVFFGGIVSFAYGSPNVFRFGDSIIIPNRKEMIGSGVIGRRVNFSIRDDLTDTITTYRFTIGASRCKEQTYIEKNDLALQLSCATYGQISSSNKANTFDIHNVYFSFRTNEIPSPSNAID